MIRNGAACLHRILAFLLTITVLMTTCFTTAFAEDIRAQISVSILWEDDNGVMQIAPAMPVPDQPEGAFWAHVDASALGKVLTVEVSGASDHVFYMVDENGQPTPQFVWLQDAPGLDAAYAYQLYYGTVGALSEVPMSLYISSVAMPQEDVAPEFTPFPVQVPVYYITSEGELLDSQAVECWAGESTPVWASSANVEGYELVGADTVEVHVDESGAASPAEVIFTYAKLATPTPEPTEEPTPTPIPEALVMVVYYHVNGDTLDYQEFKFAPGMHVITANSDAVAGLVPVGETSVTVNVQPDGSVDMASVIFTYEDAAPAEAILPVYYYHVNGEMLDMQEVTLAPGTHTVEPNSDKVEDLILVSDSSVTVNVNADGSTDVASIMFQYEDAAPAEAILPVYYYHVNGEMLDMQEVTLAPGTHIVKPNSTKVANYVLEGTSAVEVTVSADGNASMASVGFVYKDAEKAPVEAQVTVKYLHIGGEIIATETITLSEGSHTITANGDKAEGYLPVGNTSANVNVDADGHVQPDTVEFYYEDAYVAPVTAALTVLYQTDDGAPLGEEVQTLTPGDHTILPDIELFNAQGYRLVGEQSWIVHVDEKGRIEPATVVFTFQQSSLKIPVRYQDDRGRSVAPDGEVLITQDGEYVIDVNAEPPVGMVEGYELAPGQSGRVTITVIDGVPSKNEVYFYYQEKPKGPVLANVTVCYYDPNGDEIAPAQIITLAPGVHQVNAHSAETFRGYVLVSAPSITVEVYENGTFSPQEVAFYYRFAEAEAKTADVTVYFRDDRGNDVAPAQTHALADGEHVIEAPPVTGYAVFEGTDSKVTVTVKDGVASKNQVVFYYQKAQAQPSVFTIPVSYYDTMGEKVATTQYVQVAAGTYAVQANPTDLPDGYVLVSDPVMTVRVNRDGTTEPEEIAFYYRAPEKKAVVLVSYVDEEGRDILEPFTIEVSAGYQTIQADARRVPDGYDPESAKPVTIFVSREGEADPDHVTLTFDRLVIETPIPVGENVYRYAKVDSNSVAFRNEPSTSGGNKTVIKRLGRSDKVYVLKELYNDDGELWAMINVNGRIGYMMSEFIQVMSQEDSDAYTGRNTPVPTFTPGPTFTPYVTATPTLEPLPTQTLPYVEALTPPPTELPTEVPTPTPTPTASPSPTPTATPEPYRGYALTTRTTELRTGISAADVTIMNDMEANTLVRVVNQMPDPATGEMWSIIYTLSNQAGFMQDSALRYISDKEAQPYIDMWEELHKTPEPTKLATPTPEPMQLQGYGVVLGEGVPFRQMQSEFSRIIDHLAEGTMVYISGQTAGEGEYWHSANYQGRWGYIRTDLVRMLTIAEEEAYLESLMAGPTPATTNIPFDEDGLSSYGYVDSSNVNWREGPSTGEKKIGELRRYAFCLVLGTEDVNGVTWYRIKFNDQVGYIHGDFFKQMTISELEDFLGSEEHLQGVADNSPNGREAIDDLGFIGTGGLVSQEDQWLYDNNIILQKTPIPWKPIATVAPIQTSPTLEPLPGWTTSALTATPSPTATFNPLPEVTYPTANDGDGGSAVIWVFILGLLLLAGGGVFALVRHQQNKRRIAMRAAQRRAQAARAQQQQQRPYARTAAPGQPRTGTYPNQQTQVRQTASTVSQTTNTYTPYARPVYPPVKPYQEEETADPAPKSSLEGDTQRNPRVGRRTAYRQAQENSEQNKNSFDM